MAEPEQAKAVFAAGAVASVVTLLSSGSVRVQLQARRGVERVHKDRVEVSDQASECTEE